jgi:hypothetical protein
LQSAQQTFPLLCSVIETVSKSLLALRPIEDLFASQINSNEAIELASFLTNMEATSQIVTTITCCTRGIIGLEAEQSIARIRNRSWNKQSRHALEYGPRENQVGGRLANASLQQRKGRALVKVMKWRFRNALEFSR